MTAVLPDFQELFDAEGHSLGALLGSEAWAFVREQIFARYGQPGMTAQSAPPVEPLGDWRDLLAFWDFQYPVDLDVKCTCGNETADWEHDEPRKFLLTAANLGGLVSFHCLRCNAKVIKRHFKDSITVEVKPYISEKSARNFGRSR